MADTPAKRQREAQKRRNRDLKAERKRLRKEGLLGHDNSGLFAPGEMHRETVAGDGSIKSSVDREPKQDAPAPDPAGPGA
jgi:hypothetical protein